LFFQLAWGGKLGYKHERETTEGGKGRKKRTKNKGSHRKIVFLATPSEVVENMCLVPSTVLGLKRGGGEGEAKMGEKKGANAEGKWRNSKNDWGTHVRTYENEARGTVQEITEFWWRIGHARGGDPSEGNKAE